MYLSCLLIDVGDNPDRPRPGRLWLRNLYRVHQHLCMAFPSSAQEAEDPQFLNPFNPDGFQHVHGPRTEDQAFLFRIDPLPGGRVVILVQSAIKPDWGYAFQNAAYLLAAPSQVKSLDPTFAPGQSLRFRLVANPTKRLRAESIESDGNLVKEASVGKRVPVPTEKLDEWLTRRAGLAGFRVERLISVQAGYVYMSEDSKSKGKRVRGGQPDSAPAEHTSEEPEGKAKGNRLRSARYDGILEVTDPALFRSTLMRGIGPGKAFGFGLLSVAPVGRAS